MRTLGALALVAALTGCGSPDANGNASSSSVFGNSFDTGFKTQFRAKFVEQCIAGAKSTSHSNADFNPICGCTADKLLAAKNVTQLMTGPSDAETRAAAVQCAREHPVR